MDQTMWTAVDDYIVDALHRPDAALNASLDASRAAGLPAIDVSPTQGKMLHLLARMTGAKQILEIGTLGGYSTIWLARALPDGGRLVTLELEPLHADVARANLARAGLSDRAEVRVGPAVTSLEAMVTAGEGPFDFIFIDADKPSYPAYLEHAIRLSRPGTAIVCDNVVRKGAVTDAASEDANVQGVRALMSAIETGSHLDATVIQTVGMKGYDGFVIALVR